MLDSIASAFLVVEHTPREGPRWAVKWRAPEGVRVKTRLGVSAWVERVDGQWVPRTGRPVDGAVTERGARRLVPEVIEREQRRRAAIAEAQREADAPPPATFRELAAAWLHHVTTVKDVKPSTLSTYRFMLAEPGARHRRGSRQAKGLIMGHIGDVPVCDLTTGDVTALLDAIAAGGVKANTVNRHREIVVAALNFAQRPEQRARWQTTENVARWAPKRKIDQAARLEVFTVEQVEAVARVAADGSWRTAREYATPVRDQWQAEQDQQLADLIRVAAYTGIRRGELLTLRMRDIDWSDRVLVVERALSATEERSTKGRRVRYVPLGDQALAAFDRLSRRKDFVGPDDYVFCNEAGDRLDPSALRRRYTLARDAAGVPPLRFHDLRHTAGTLLTRILDPVTVKDILGHADLKTTERYLHARKASGLSDAATKAFAAAEVPDPANDADVDHQAADRLAKALIRNLGPDEVAALLRDA